MTHWEDDAAEACVLWCVAMRRAVLTGEVDVRGALGVLSEPARGKWSTRLDEAEAKRPRDFPHNGWVVQAVQGAWSAIYHTAQPLENPGSGTFAAQRMRLALEAAVRGGKDTDTVAAIAGGLLGAAYGASAVPASWRRRIHGWPGMRSSDLTRVALRIARGGKLDRSDQPQIGYSSSGDTSMLVRHPHDAGVWLGGVGALQRIPAEVDAVVSLCQIGYDEVPAERILPENRVEAWLIDTDDPKGNAHLAFALSDAADAVAELRAEGHQVLLHCVQAMTRTPTVAALYGSRRAGIPTAQALVDVSAVLPLAHPNPLFVSALDQFV